MQSILSGYIIAVTDLFIRAWLVALVGWARRLVTIFASKTKIYCLLGLDLYHCIYTLVCHPQLAHHYQAVLTSAVYLFSSIVRVDIDEGVTCTLGLEHHLLLLSPEESICVRLYPLLSHILCNIVIGNSSGAVFLKVGSQYCFQSIPAVKCGVDGTLERDCFVILSNSHTKFFLGKNSTDKKNNISKVNHSLRVVCCHATIKGREGVCLLVVL